MRKGSKDDSSAEKLLRWGHLTLTVSQMFESRSVVEINLTALDSTVVNCDILTFSSMPRVAVEPRVLYVRLRR